MSIENGYRPDQDKTKNNRLKKIVAGLAALGTAGYLTTSESRQDTRDKKKDTYSDRQPAPKPTVSDAGEGDVRFHPSLPSPETATPNEFPDDTTTDILQRPSPEDSVVVDPKELISFPRELQEQANELHAACHTFYTEDPQNLIDPLRPSIVEKIFTGYNLLQEEAKKYPNAPSFNEDNFCGDRDRFNTRLNQLAKITLQGSYSNAQKREILRDLYRHVNDQNFFHGALSYNQEISDAFKSFTDLPKNELHDLYLNYYNYALTKKGSLSNDEYEHLAYKLYLAKSNDALAAKNSGAILSDEERAGINAFIEPYLFHNAMEYQAKNYLQWEDYMKNPPAEGSSQDTIDAWERDRDIALMELVKSIDASMEDGISIDPKEYGCPYSLQELRSMLRDFEK